MADNSLHRGKTTIRNCQHCQTPFEIRIAEIQRGAGKYCSRKCHFDHRRIISAKKRELMID